MAIVVTVEGAVAEKDVAESTYMTDLAATFSAGDAVFVITASETVYDIIELAKSDNSVVRSKTAAERDLVILNTQNVEGACFSFLNLTSQEATDIAKVRLKNSIVENTIAFAVYSASGIAISSAFDKSATATGSGTTAGAGPTATLSQADELGIGIIGMEEQTDEKGTWTTGASYVEGNEQEAGTTGQGGASNISVFTVAEVLSATTAQNVEQTSTGGNDWAAGIATYKGAGGPPPPTAQRFGVVV